MRIPGRSAGTRGVPADGSEQAPQASRDGLRADPAAHGPDTSFVVDQAVYREGHRILPGTTGVGTPVIDPALGLTWLGLVRPTAEEFAGVAAHFGLHELAAEDAVQAHQRPKMERYDDTLFVVLRPAHYDDAAEEVVFGEVHVFVGPSFVITVRHGDAPRLDLVRRRLEAAPALLAMGPEAVLYAILDTVVDDYAPVIAGLEQDIEQIEAEVFRGDPAVSQRIYELSREVIEFHRAAKPLDAVLRALAGGFTKYGVDATLQSHLRDVRDHLILVVEHLEQMRQLLQNILATNATLVQLTQNAEMQSLTQASYDQSLQVKRISAWAAILFAPTVIGTAYGMNFPNMPELEQEWGYPFALALMASVCLTLWWLFRRRGWL